MLDKLLNEYVNKFDENFPIFAVNNVDIENIIQNCLATNTKYEPIYGEQSDY